MSFQPPGGPPPPPPPGGPPGNPYPPQGYPGPQPPWVAGPPSKKRGNGWQWGLGALALLLVIGVTAAVTISVTKDGGDGGGDTSPPGETYGLASAGDTGPVNVITEDPSCAAWRKVNARLADSQNGWAERDPSIPGADWTPNQRAQHEAVARAMSDAADQSVPLAKLTPHRVMRELYEQFIAYARAYGDAIPSYTPIDNHLASIALSSSGASPRFRRIQLRTHTYLGPPTGRLRRSARHAKRSEISREYRPAS